MRSILLITLLGSFAALAHSQTADNDGAQASFQKAAASIDSDLEIELKKLADLRQHIASEKAQLGGITAEVAANLREKRRLTDLARLKTDDLNHDLRAITKRVGEWRSESDYIDSLLVEFRKQFGVDLHPAQVASISKLFTAAEAPAENAFQARAEIASAAIDQLSAINGPQKIIGQAIDSEGISRNGRYVIAGPVAWFVSEDGMVAGITDGGDGLQPRVLDGTADGKSIAAIADGTTSKLKLDPSLGSAIAIDQANDSLFDHIRQGGIWIWPILLLALVATSAAISKWFQLLRIRDLKPTLIRQVIFDVNQGDESAAKEKLTGIHHPAAEVLRRGAEFAGSSSDRETIEEALYEKFLEAQPPLQRGLPLIAIASASAPLLGLLGTVTGMIHTFKLINLFGTGDARSLATGISEALVTTEFGLIVAIPALILHALLSRKVQGIKSTMEMSSLAFLNGLSLKSKGQ